MTNLPATTGANSSRQRGSVPLRTMWLLPVVVVALVLLVVLREPALAARATLVVASLAALGACFLGPLVIADCPLVAQPMRSRPPAPPARG